MLWVASRAGALAGSKGLQYAETWCSWVFICSTTEADFLVSPLVIMWWRRAYERRCPITLSVMREPAQASSGVTYERSAIFQWLSVHRVDPVTQVSTPCRNACRNAVLFELFEGCPGLWLPQWGQARTKCTCL